MCFNAGKIDRVVRIVVGLGLIAFGISNENLLVAGIGAIPLITGLIGFCPFYPIFKINTGCDKNS